MSNIKLFKTVFPIMVLAALGVAGWFFYQRNHIQRSLPEGLIQANGRIEGETHVVATKIAGKIVRMLAKEGDAVKAGDILAVLDDSQIRERVQQASFALASAKARLEASQSAYRLLEREIPLGIDRARAAKAHAEALLAKAVAAERQSARDAERYARLAEEGTIGRQKSEHAWLALTSARSDRDSAESGVTQARKLLEDALLGPSRLQAKAEELKAVAALTQQAEAALAEARSIETDLSVRAPIDGIVTVKTVNAGEVVASGAPLFSMIDLDALYLKVYVPEKQIGKLRRGLSARIFIDAIPDAPFDGTVTYIASRAEFTPKEVQTPDERVKLVYAVKIALDHNPGHRLTPGIPADAVIRWKEDAAWSKPVW
ncbi:HlyD family secretion protein [Desulfatirhabdium butyrativorans]|uniref:HlyD family secretion protein n=1 Tax=Desulfatirhabdium butyrativorans TaxID=340467 RepID=UPI00042A6AE1|nr:efflux RND transporter periplasmic adaptor subunit [Desulfatirhabdium butyrativorans]